MLCVPHSGNTDIIADIKKKKTIQIKVEALEIISITIFSFAISHLHIILLQTLYPLTVGT